MEVDVPGLTAMNTSGVTSGVTDISALPGLKSLWAKTIGDPRVCVAVLDGPVDQSHPCFEGANLTRLPSLVSDVAGSGLMSGHGTHIASTIFGQPGSPIHGVAPGCRGLSIPVFSDNQKGRLSQLNLARAINQAVEEGAHVINISGGQKVEQAEEADPFLTKAVQFCNDEGVLIVAAAGNDGCECLHVPAALPSALAVGAMNNRGLPFDFSNWGETYQSQGILAPGEKILGAVPGGGTALMSGTSFANPIVSGIAALLLSIQLLRGEKPDPHAVRAALLNSALPCDPKSASDCRHFLVGSLNIPGAHTLITKGEIKDMSDPKSEVEMIQLSEANNLSQAESTNQQEVNNSSQADSVNQLSANTVPETAAVVAGSTPAPMQVAGNRMAVMPSNMVAVPAMPGNNGMVAMPYQMVAVPAMPSNNGMAVMPSNVAATPVVSNNGVTASATPNGVVNSGACGCNNGTVASAVTPSQMGASLVYAIGIVGYDFGTEARRDSFKQLMPEFGPEIIPPNPYDARQMVPYLQENLDEAKSLIWTLNLELTPIYAIEPQGSFGDRVYQELVDALSGQIEAEDEPGYIERVSIPGILTGKTVTLFSGEVVPVIQISNIRGFYGWKIQELITGVLDAIDARSEENPEEFPPLNDQQRQEVEYSLRSFLERIYYDLRNLGQTSQERALNYSATNLFQNADALIEVLANRRRPSLRTTTPEALTMQLDTITAERSPFCRKDSDCWDIKIKFFDPENNKRAKRVIRYTIDLSDLVPVTLGKVRIWDESF